MSLGITKVYEIKKRVKKVLILNEKVVDYLYKRLTTAGKGFHYWGEPDTKHLVFLTGYNNYEEITKDKIRELLKDEDNLEKDIIAELAYAPEYDWKVIKYSLVDFLYEDKFDILLNRVTKSSTVRKIEVEVGDMPKEQVVAVLRRVEDLFERKPYFAKHPEEFDFEDKVEEDNYRCVEERYW